MASSRERTAQIQTTKNKNKRIPTPFCSRTNFLSQQNLKKNNKVLSSLNSHLKPVPNFHCSCCLLFNCIRKNIFIMGKQQTLLFFVRLRITNGTKQNETNLVSWWFYYGCLCYGSCDDFTRLAAHLTDFTSM